MKICRTGMPEVGDESRPGKDLEVQSGSSTDFQQGNGPKNVLFGRTL